MQFDTDSYENEDFSSRIMEMEDISKKKFTGCKFRRADFSDVSVIYGCTFDTCDFAGARLNGVNIKQSAFLSCQFIGQCVTIAEHLTEGKYSPEEKVQGTFFTGIA